jgi:uncharacterized protein (TIGR00255 family)
MTGFGAQEKEVNPFGKISVELRSSNHKFLETVFHLPEALLALEDKIKKEVEREIKRGRVTCAVNILGGNTPGVFINKALLKNYVSSLRNIQGQFNLKEGLGLDTLISLPGVLSLQENLIPKAKIWPQIKITLVSALAELVKTRQKEGRAIYGYLKSRAGALKTDLDTIKIRFKKVLKEKLGAITTDEERNSFLKETDISEEVERLAFHIRNFKHKLSKNGPAGKELDFIAQEMQREANTLAAKTFDTVISSRVVQIKSQIEKIREQAQNIE